MSAKSAKSVGGCSLAKGWLSINGDQKQGYYAQPGDLRGILRQIFWGIIRAIVEGNPGKNPLTIPSTSAPMIPPKSP